MEQVSVFLLLVGVLQFLSKHSSFGIEISNKCSTLFHKVKGEALTGHVISVQEASSEIDCTSKCLSNPNCASFNFEIQNSRSLSICELNNVSRTYSNNTLKRNDSFAYYEPITPRERPKQEIQASCPAVTTQGTQEVSPTQVQAATPASMVPSTQPGTTGTPTSNCTCGQQWHAYKSGCLRLFQDHKYWVAANQYCATFNTPGEGNGRLISIFSQDENNQIVNLRSSQGFPEGEYYVGLNDLQGTRTYQWADGTNASFTNWNTGYPKYGRGVVIKMSRRGNSDNGKWQTRNYRDALRFICECPDGPCA